MPGLCFPQIDIIIVIDVVGKGITEDAEDLVQLSRAYDQTYYSKK
jgi:hypothetical protein